MSCGDPNCYICNPVIRKASLSSCLEQALGREQERYSLLENEKRALEKRLNGVENVGEQNMEYEI